MRLAEQQLSALTQLFRQGADEASLALSRWLERPAQVMVKQVEQIPLREATEVLGDAEEPICFCIMGLHGRLTGQLILACDDACGWGLADLLMGKPVGTSQSWSEMEQSAALETSNIIGCAYLNALARAFPDAGDSAASELMPTPPKFARDFPEALIQFALMNQAMASDFVFLTHTELHIEHEPVNCHLLFVPDAECTSSLLELLPR